MEKIYEPKDVESKLYAQWEAAGYFHAEVTPGKPKYSITIPPPNVTGSLHMGHALTYSIQDVLGRWKRMSGFETLILPGTDHAGIATQTVVEKKIAKDDGVTRQELGREEFVKRVWDWKDEYGTRIISQFKRLGHGFDWDRARFTLDDAYADAVTEAFVRFYDMGLIYKGNRMVNWSVGLQTVISDIEVEEIEQDGFLWHIQYPLADGSGFVTVATTRPETMLGDTAVAVNPNDERYKTHVGKMVNLPLTNRQIPIIADDYASMEFGTGAVKITPAHDPNDYEVGKRHDLPQLTVIGFDGKLTPDAGERYSGLERFEARDLIVSDLEELGVLAKIEPHHHAVPHCERSHTVIEPLLSDQWFMKMSGTELVKKAIDAAESDDVRFVPERYKKIYLDWMYGLRDWPLSRQLWWGHRLPIYYTPDGTPVAARSLAEAVERAGTDQLTQDEDVLDTWFSSALWPFATMGWPNKTPELDYFYPTNVLTTSREILYLWVARMLMTGLEFMGEKPFDEVYIFATVLDAKGRRMSKSLGNGIDPVEMIDKYGADALRFSLLRLASKGQDIRFAESRIPESRNFANKLWNAARFVLMNLPDDFPSGQAIAPNDLPSRWILSRLQRTIQTVNAAFESYNFDDACAALYEFVWNDFCDWFLELAKPSLFADEPTAKRQIQTTLLHVLDATLRLLHPLMPFVTEEIWQSLPHDGPSLCIAAFPSADETLIDADAELSMTLLIESISALRTLRAEFTPGGPENEAARAAMLTRRLTVTVVTESEKARETLESERAAMTTLARLGSVTFTDAPPESKTVAVGITGATLYVPADELLEGIDPAKETARLTVELAKLEKELAALTARLGNPGFVQKAAPEAVEKARQDASDLAARREKLEARRALLGDQT